MDFPVVTSLKFGETSLSETPELALSSRTPALPPLPPQPASSRGAEKAASRRPRRMMNMGVFSLMIVAAAPVWEKTSRM